MRFSLLPSRPIRSGGLPRRSQIALVLLLILFLPSQVLAQSRLSRQEFVSAFVEAMKDRDVSQMDTLVLENEPHAAALIEEIQTRRLSKERRTAKTYLFVGARMAES